MVSGPIFLKTSIELTNDFGRQVLFAFPFVLGLNCFNVKVLFLIDLITAHLPKVLRDGIPKLFFLLLFFLLFFVFF